MALLSIVWLPEKREIVETMPDETNQYVPALRFRWLTRIYDPVVALTTREKTFKRQLLDQARIEAGSKVLDVGCGTGTLTTLIKTRQPRAMVSGLDGDPAIIKLATVKAARAGLEIQFDEGLSFDLPYREDQFDIIFSTLFFHHLTRDNKVRTLAEVLRVLNPGGKLHICDWGRPSNPLLRLMFLAVQCLDGFDVTRDHAKGRLVEFIQSVGFSDVTVTGRLTTMLGTLDFITATRPER